MLSMRTLLIIHSTQTDQLVIITLTLLQRLCKTLKNAFKLSLIGEKVIKEKQWLSIKWEIMMKLLLNMKRELN
jgi:hypothetical protein